MSAPANNHNTRLTQLHVPLSIPKLFTPRTNLNIPFSPCIQGKVKLQMKNIRTQIHRTSFLMENQNLPNTFPKSFESANILVQWVCQRHNQPQIYHGQSLMRLFCHRKHLRYSVCIIRLLQIFRKLLDHGCRSLTSSFPLALELYSLQCRRIHGHGNGKIS